MIYFKKFFKTVIYLLALGCVLLTPQTVLAEAKQAELVTTDEQKDLAVMFTFDSEVVDLVFISPSGVRKTQADSDVEYAAGDLWSTYRIINAEAGTWSVEYDLKSNSGIDYSIIDDDYGIWIQYFEVAERTDERAKVRFDAACESEIVWYNYVIYAVNTQDAGDIVKLTSGYTRSEEEQEAEVMLTSLTNGNYVLKLEVYYRDGDAELFDTLTSEPFDYVNPNEPESIEDYMVSVDQSNLTCKVDWDDYAVWMADGYRLVVYSDGSLIYEADYDGRKHASSILFPAGTKKLQVELYYKDNDIWSKPLTKVIDLEDEYLRLLTEEVTNAGQVTLEYQVKEERTLEVTVNGESGSFLLNESGQLSFDIVQGNNSVYASFEGDAGVSYQIDAEVYFDEYPPEITLFEDLDGKTFYEDSIVIMGSITGGNKLLVNGNETAIGEKGRFEITEQLTSGENVITLEAFDVNGNSAVMKLTLYKGKKIGAKTTSGSKGWQQYIPLAVSLLVSLLIVILGLVFIKKKDKSQTAKTRIWPMIVWDVLVGIADIALAVGYVLHYKKSNAPAFLEMAEKSVPDAVSYLQEERFLAIAAVVGLLVLLVSILMTVTKKLIIMRKKK